MRKEAVKRNSALDSVSILSAQLFSMLQTLSGSVLENDWFLITQAVLHTHTRCSKCSVLTIISYQRHVFLRFSNSRHVCIHFLLLHQHRLRLHQLHVWRLHDKGGCHSVGKHQLHIHAATLDAVTQFKPNPLLFADNFQVMFPFSQSVPSPVWRAFIHSPNLNGVRRVWQQLEPNSSHMCMEMFTIIESSLLNH